MAYALRAELDERSVARLARTIGDRLVPVNLARLAFTA